MKHNKQYSKAAGVFAFLFLANTFCCINLFAQNQNVGINYTGATPDASALLDIDAQTGPYKGLLIPRVALTATNNASPISSPATSLLIYNTATAGTFPNNVIPGYYYWNGTAWINLISSGGVGSSQWLTSGSNIYYNAGNVGIGINSTDATLHVLGSGNVAIIEETSAATFSSRNTVINKATSTGTMLDGFGPQNLFSVKDGDADNNIGGFNFVRSGGDKGGKFNLFPRCFGFVVVGRDLARLLVW